MRILCTTQQGQVFKDQYAASHSSDPSFYNADVHEIVLLRMFRDPMHEKEHGFTMLLHRISVFFQVQHYLVSKANSGDFSITSV